MSPAINDTFTAVACVDFIGDALLVLVDALPCDGTWRDQAGVLRLHVPPLRLDRLVKMAFDQIRQAAADNPAVLIRMLNIIGRLAARVHDRLAAQALAVQADAIRTTAFGQNHCAGRFNRY